MNQKQIINKLLWIASSEDAGILRSSLLNFVADLIKEGVTTEETSQDRNFSIRVKENLLLRDHCTCAYCNRVGTFTEDPDGESWEVDHIIPISRGGLTAESNAALSCWKCNNEKSDKTPTEYLRSLRFKKAILSISKPDADEGDSCSDETFSSPLLSGRPLLDSEKALLVNTYTITGSKNETMRLVWGGKNAQRAAWLNEVLKGEQAQ